MNNQEFRIRPKIINLNINEPSFYPYSIEINICSGSCNNINNPYANLCVPNVVKNMNVKVFNLVSRTTEIRDTEWHETCKCKCKLDIIVCNTKQPWNKDKYKCEFKELVDKGRCDEGFVWNPSNCECECDKSCGTGQYLDYENCKCRKKISENIDENQFLNRFIMGL